MCGVSLLDAVGWMGLAQFALLEQADGPAGLALQCGGWDDAHGHSFARWRGCPGRWRVQDATGPFLLVATEGMIVHSVHNVNVSVHTFSEIIPLERKR